MKKIKRVLSVVLVLLIAFGNITLACFADGFPQMQVEVSAKAALLMDATTGKVLMAKNADERLYPASVTKIMSILLIFEALESGKIDLEDVVTTSKYASSMGGSEIWLKEGEQMNVHEMLKAICVASANDACVAMGEYIAGSNEAFVNMMNERARQLGMTNTTFINCTGLDDSTDEHLTTAYDIALMSRELLKHKHVIDYTTIWTDSLRDGETLLTNTNKLVRFYDGCTGLKTGTTSKAGCCLSATATRNGTTLISVVLGCDNSEMRFEGAKAMLNWGFANVSTVVPEVNTELITDVNVLYGIESKITPVIPEISPVLIEKGMSDSIEQKVELPVDIEAPVEQGQILGALTLYSDGEIIGEYKLVSDRYIKRLTFFEALKRILYSFRSKNS